MKHMHARAANAGLCGSAEAGPVVAREAVVLRALVFDFPASCSFHEYVARVRYVIDVLGSRTRQGDLLWLHGAYMRVSHGVSRNEMRDLICSFVEFVCRNAASLGYNARAQMDACAIFVRALYPRLICTASLGAAKKSERMLLALERATGARDFLVLADVLLACATPRRDRASLHVLRERD